MTREGWGEAGRVEVSRGRGEAQRVGVIWKDWGEVRRVGVRQGGLG